MFILLRLCQFVFFLGLFALGAILARSQTSTFTYQGRLTDGGTTANGTYDLQFKLYDALTSGNQLPIGSPVTLTKTGVIATNGIFTVQLDFGASVFPGADRFLEISVKRPTDSSYTSLNPRQQLASTPYSVQALSATNAVNATNATQLGGVAATQYVITTDARLSDARNPSPGSPNYIQNAMSPQSAANFNISGDGMVGGTFSGNVLNAATQYNIGGSRVLGVAGSGNFFAGLGTGTHNTGSFNSFVGTAAGTSNTMGSFNLFVGGLAGWVNTEGGTNSFLGTFAGESNTTGGGNVFVGASAGVLNTTGNFNSFAGESAGFNNRTGSSNAFFGESAGYSNTTASNNAFFGTGAGRNTTGESNSFVGGNTGYNNTTGNDDTFVGAFVGFSNTTENQNTFLGSHSNGAATVANSTAIGAYASVTQSNSLVLGSINGVNGADADTSVGIGTTAPNARLHIAANGGSILLGDAGCGSGSTGIGFGSSLSGCTNYSLRGDGTDTNINRPTGGTIYFRENNTAQVIIEPGGILAIGALGGGPGVTLCRNNMTKEISNCSSSIRYKDHLASFTSGLDLINKLRPITFNWKQSGERDLGFVAEDVAAIEPLLVTHNDKGQIEGVKYDRLSVAFVNAFKEQQAQIQRQQEQIKSQQDQIDALRKLICLDRPNIAVCK